MSIQSVLKRLLGDAWFYGQETKEKTLSTALSHANRSTKNYPDIVHGTVAVLDGKVIVTDPKNDGTYATLIVPDNPMVQVFVNGKQVQGKVVLSQLHKVDIKFSSVEPSVWYDVIVSDDELSVSVRANVEKGIKFHLKDSIPSRNLRLVIEEIYTYPDHVPQEVILNLLTQNGYKGTIDYAAVNRLCNASGTQEEVVLRGAKPKQGRPAKIRLSSTCHAESDPVFRTSRYPKVVIGTTCAVVESKKKGVFGANVYGVPLPPPKSEQRLPSLGVGVININGNIVAVRDGRLMYQKRLIDVVPEMVFEKDVSAKDGEIQFNGNIVVRGSIRDGANVKASGMITVYGDIEASSVFSGQGVLVRKGIYGSNVMSGHQQNVYENLSRLLNKMIPELKRFGDEYSLMVAHAIKRYDARATIPKIPVILFQKRHENLVQMLERFVDDYSDELCGSDTFYRELKELVGTTWSGDKRHNVSQRDTEFFLDKLVSFNNRIESYPKQRTVVKATDIASSTIRSIGNIIIKRNCYSSTLESGNTVSVQRTLVGGFVIAEKSVIVRELGSPSGVETSVRVNNSSGFIRIKLNHINTLVEVHGRRVRTCNTEQDVRYGGGQYDKDGDRR